MLTICIVTLNRLISNKIDFECFGFCLLIFRLQFDFAPSFLFLVFSVHLVPGPSSYLWLLFRSIVFDSTLHCLNRSIPGYFAIYWALTILSSPLWLILLSTLYCCCCCLSFIFSSVHSASHPKLFNFYCVCLLVKQFCCLFSFFIFRCVCIPLNAYMCVIPITSAHIESYW